MATMTVWIENPFDNLPQEGYRPQRYGLMAEAFARAGHDVTLWTGDFSHASKAKRILKPAAEPSPFRLRLLPVRPYASNVSLRRFLSHRAYADAWWHAAKDLPPPDLIVVSLPPLGTATVARRLARCGKTRLVVDVMDAWPETFLRLAPRALRPTARLALAPLFREYRTALREADLVTVVADRYAADARAAGAKNVRRFYHGIALPPPPTNTRAPAATRLVYAGSLGRTYDLATALRALALLPDATLDIAGSGETEGALKALAHQLGVSDRVRFHGYLGERDLRDLLAKGGLGLVPMSDDSCVGIPYKFADYSSGGLPILTSLGGESANLLARYGAGFSYAAGDAHALAEAVKRLAADRAAPAAARKMAEAEFDASAIYPNYVETVLHGSH